MGAGRARGPRCSSSSAATLITGQLAREHAEARGGSPGRGFYARRAVRLMPAALGYVAVAGGAFVALGGHASGTGAWARFGVLRLELRGGVHARARQLAAGRAAPVHDPLVAGGGGAFLRGVAGRTGVAAGARAGGRARRSPARGRGRTRLARASRPALRRPRGRRSTACAACTPTTASTRPPTRGSTASPSARSPRLAGRTRFPPPAGRRRGVALLAASLAFRSPLARDTWRCTAQGAALLVLVPAADPWRRGRGASRARLPAAARDRAAQLRALPLALAGADAGGPLRTPWLSASRSASACSPRPLAVASWFGLEQPFLALAAAARLGRAAAASLPSACRPAHAKAWPEKARHAARGLGRRPGGGTRDGTPAGPALRAARVRPLRRAGGRDRARRLDRLARGGIRDPAQAATPTERRDAYGASVLVALVRGSVVATLIGPRRPRCPAAAAQPDASAGPVGVRPRPGTRGGQPGAGARSTTARWRWAGSGAAPARARSSSGLALVASHGALARRGRRDRPGGRRTSPRSR